MKKLLSLAAVIWALSGCSLSSQKVHNTATYDLGAAPAANTYPLPASLMIADVEAPQWLQGRAILYRLAYQNDKHLQPYANSKWVAPPTELLSLRLRQYFASGQTSSPEDRTRTSFILRIELETFEQVFASPSSSQGVLRAKAILINGADRRLIAQKTFVIAQESPSLDAAGGITALSGASAQWVQSVHEWVATTLPAGAK